MISNSWLLLYPVDLSHFRDAKASRLCWKMLDCRGQNDDRPERAVERQPTGRSRFTRTDGVHRSLLGISRGSVYYQPRPVSDADLKLMHRIDKLHTEFLFAGSRMLHGLLAQEGSVVGRLHVATLMKCMGIEALYRKPNTSKPAPGHKTYPYLLRSRPVQ